MSGWSATDPNTGNVIYMVPDAERRRIVLEQAKCPRRHRGAADIDLRDDVDGWDGETWALIFLGGAGAGKTWMATRVFAELGSRRRRSSWWIAAADLIQRTKDEMDEGGSERSLAKARECGVLLLDDLGAERPTPWACDVIGNVLAHRYNEELPTIVTTNLPFDEIKTLDQRLVSRLDGDGRVIVMDDEDRRRV